MRILEQAAARYEKPAYLLCDKGGQFNDKAARLWAGRNGVRMTYNDPGRPWRNGAVESLVTA